MGERSLLALAISCHFPLGAAQRVTCKQASRGLLKSRRLSQPPSTPTIIPGPTPRTLDTFQELGTLDLLHRRLCLSVDIVQGLACSVRPHHANASIWQHAHMLKDLVPTSLEERDGGYAETGIHCLHEHSENRRHLARLMASDKRNESLRNIRQVSRL